jgi:hypothetical protein
MKRCILAILVVGVPTFVAAAPRQRVVQQEAALTVVPFAVPVATPVAVINPTGVFYAYSPLAATHGATNGDATSDDWREFEEFRRWKASQSKKASGVVAGTCLKCHSGPAAKAGIRLDEPLAAEARLKAIRAVLAGRMPKDKPLSASEISGMVAELAAETDQR